MYHKHHTKGVVLGNRDDGVDSKRVNIFTENFGLLNVKVQGSRTIQSKLRYGIQDYSFGEFSLVHGKSGWKLVSVRPEKNLFEDFKESKTKLRVTASVLNLLKKLAPEQESSVYLFSIISNFLDFLVTAPEESIFPAECLVLLRILNNLGYLRDDPDLKASLSYSDISNEDIETLIPRRLKVVELINESLKATQILA